MKRAAATVLYLASLSIKCLDRTPYFMHQSPWYRFVRACWTFLDNMSDKLLSNNSTDDQS